MDGVRSPLWTTTTSTSHVVQKTHHFYFTAVSAYVNQSLYYLAHIIYWVNLQHNRSTLLTYVGLLLLNNRQRRYPPPTTDIPELTALEKIPRGLVRVRTSLTGQTGSGLRVICNCYPAHLQLFPILRYKMYLIIIIIIIIIVSVFKVSF